MTKTELRGILRNKTVYVVRNGSRAVSRFKFFTIKNNELVDITKDIAEAGGYKLTKEREIKETVCGMDRVFSVLYNAYYNIKTKKEAHRGSFKSVYMN